MFSNLNLLVKYFNVLICIYIVFNNEFGIKYVNADENEDKNNKLHDNLQKSLINTNDILKKISERWEISNYPNFLNSVAMTHTSWEVMKLKFQSKILQSATGVKDVKFIISFMGSSVTAGHDSNFNVSFSQLTAPRMSTAFKPLNVEIISRGAALGNNPCLPYDLCVRAHAGADADLVHWEQSYNCFGSDENKRPIFEQFIRQSLTLPNSPIVIFAESSSPNWKADECKDDKNKSPIVADKKDLLRLEQIEKDPMLVASEMNSGELSRKWDKLLDMFKSYKTAGIQMWSHGGYERYKCRGPYISNWGCCSASWHPSLLGHELRADHHAYFWLLIFKDAIIDLQKKLKDSTPDVILSQVVKHVSSEHKHIPIAPLYPSSQYGDFKDGLQCFTSFRPRFDDNYALESIYIPNPEGLPNFQHQIVEEVQNPGALKNAILKGYVDKKYMYHGNKNSGALSFSIKVVQDGKGFLCQPAGDWGKLPNGFQNFWEIGTEIYLTKNYVKTEKLFEYKKDNSVLLDYKHRSPKDTQTICVDFELPVGNHILSIVPTTDIRIMISHVIIP